LTVLPPRRRGAAPGRTRVGGGPCSCRYWRSFRSFGCRSTCSGGCAA